MNKLIYKTSFKLFRVFKALYWNLRGPRDTLPTDIAFVVGCQRSGTSLLLTVFEWDRRTKVYRELHEIFSGQSMRLRPLEEVENVFRACRHPAVIAKPLLDSQLCNELLTAFPNSHLFWTFRHYEEAVLSNLQHFGERNGIDDIRPIAKRFRSDWRAEHVPESVQRLVDKHFSEDVNPHDAAALFWLSRNQLFFDLHLQNDPRVSVCKYEDLAAHPHEFIGAIYAALGRNDLPSSFIYKEIRPSSSHRRSAIQIAPDIRDQCEVVWRRLCTLYDCGPIAAALPD